MGILCSGRANVWRRLNEAPVRNEPQSAQSLRNAQINWEDNQCYERRTKISSLSDNQSAVVNMVANWLKPNSEGVVGKIPDEWVKILMKTMFMIKL